MNKRTNIRHWESTHNDWLRALNFYKEEIAILNKRLTEIAGRNTGKEIAPQVEHFQNQFILHRNNIDELEHALKVNLQRVAAEIDRQSGFVDNDLLEQLKHVHNQFLEEEMEINKTRHEFSRFCATWM